MRTAGSRRVMKVTNRHHGAHPLCRDGRRYRKTVGMLLAKIADEPSAFVLCCRRRSPPQRFVPRQLWCASGSPDTKKKMY